MTLLFDVGAKPELVARARALRHQVFIAEQGISEKEEWDALDEVCIHFVGYVGDGDVATGRLYVADNVAKLQRIAVAKRWRGHNIGAKLIEAMIATAKMDIEVQTIELGAQCYALGFYEKLGFVANGPIYDDAGIDHRMMRYQDI